MEIFNQLKNAFSLIKCTWVAIIQDSFRAPGVTFLISNFPSFTASFNPKWNTMLGNGQLFISTEFQHKANAGDKE